MSRLLLALFLTLGAGCAALLGPPQTARHDSAAALEAAESVLYGADDWCHSGWFGRRRTNCAIVRDPACALVAAAKAFHAAADADRDRRRQELRAATRAIEVIVERHVGWWTAIYFDDALLNLRWHVDEGERRQRLEVVR